jgi:hypothetical protein
MAELCHIARAQARARPQAEGIRWRTPKRGRLRVTMPLRDGVLASPRCLQEPKIRPSVADRSQP